MIVKYYRDVEALENKQAGFKGAFARYLWSADDECPNFAMRLMEFEPHGHTSHHSHREEHEFYILEGEPAYVDAEGNEIRLKVGDTLYVPPDEPHQIKNAGSTVMKLL
jgi:quercetin dioxygenase-like cupin family protein